MMENAVWFERIANALLAICSGLALVLGAIWGKKKSTPTTEPGRMEIAGALIDGKEAQALRASIDANTAALERNTTATERNVTATSQSVDKIDGASDEIRELRLEMRFNARRD